MTRRDMLRMVGLLAALTSVGGTAVAQSEVREHGADDDAGWGAPAPAAAPRAAPSGSTAASAPSPLHITAKLRERVGFWLERADPSRIAQLRSSLELAASYSLDFELGGLPANLRSGAGMRAEYDAAYRISPASYDRATLDAYELRLIGLETFIGLRLGGVLELRSGRMVTALGQGEVQSAIDVLNPRDLREPGLTELEEFRLPSWTTRVSLSQGPHRVEAIVVHEASFGMLPPLLGRFSPVRALLLRDKLAEPRVSSHDWAIEHVPSGLDPRATQLVARYSYAGHGLDFELYAGSVLDQLGVAKLPAAAAYERQLIRLDVYHPRYTLLAVAGAKTVGDFLLRWELSAQLDRAQSVRDIRYAAPVFVSMRRPQVNVLGGLTYFGWNDVNLGVELLQSLVMNNPDHQRGSSYRLLWPVEEPSLALRYQHLWFDQTVELSVIALVVGVHPWNGALVTASLGYLARDTLRIKLHYAHYQPSSHFGNFYGFEDNDRLDLSFTWSLTIL